MSKKVRKFPLFLVSILCVLVFSVLVIPAFATEAVVNGGAESGSVGWSTNVGVFEYSEGGRTGTYCFNDSVDDSNYGFDFYQTWGYVAIANVSEFSFYWETNGESTSCTLEVFVYLKDWVSEVYTEEGWVTVYVDSTAGASSWENINITGALEAFGYTSVDEIGGVGFYVQTNSASNWIAIDDVTMVYSATAGEVPDVEPPTGY